MKKRGWIVDGYPSCPGKASPQRHVASGIRVLHCGHPTATSPYYAIDERGGHDVVVTHNGRGWRTMALAIAAIDRVVGGEARITTERCVRGIARVVEQGQT